MSTVALKILTYKPLTVISSMMFSDLNAVPPLNVIFSNESAERNLLTSVRERILDLSVMKLKN